MPFRQRYIGDPAIKQSTAPVITIEASLDAVKDSILGNKPGT